MLEYTNLENYVKQIKNILTDYHVQKYNEIYYTRFCVIWRRPQEYILRRQEKGNKFG